MTAEFIRQELRNLMETINEQQEQVLSHAGKIPQIEIDILMDNMRKAYERLMELNKTVTPHQTPAPVQMKETEMLIANESSMAIQEKPLQVQQQPEAERIETADEMAVAPAPNVEAHVQPEVIVASVETPVIPIVQEVVTEAVLPQAAMAKERAREFSKPSVKYTATASLFDDTPTIAGQFQGSKTVRDKIADAREDKSIAEKLQQHPVSDLKKSIGINEKFSFINELFDGDMDSYNSAIEQLNTSPTMSEAMNVLSNQLATKFGWSHDGESYLQLKNLLERRFSA